MGAKSKDLRIIVDSAIPYIQGVLEPYAEIQYVAGNEITPTLCQEADVLVIRTRTRCDESLLSASPVKLIASATIGTDHIDLDYCAAQGIQVVNAPGCNAWAVVQWVVSCMLHLNQRSQYSYQEWLVGIVGVGSIGLRLAETLEHFGVQTLLCDPFREPEDDRFYVPLSRIAQECDLITLHVPHTSEGEYPTHHLFDREFFHKLRRRPYILNTSRGGVIDDYELLEAKQRKRIRGYCLDVYEDEPDIAPVLLELAAVCTPHIAGYSIEGKLAGTQAVLDAVCQQFNLPQLRATSPIAEGKEKPYVGGYSMMDMAKGYSCAEEMLPLRKNPQSFERLRNEYTYRHDWRGLRIGSQSLQELLERYP